MKTDLEIQKDVLDELKWEPMLNAAEIGVAVTNGVVTLSGTLDSYFKKARVEKAAKRVAGVKAVAEHIEVNLNGVLFKRDSDIAQTILNALKWHSAVEDEKIKVKVENGEVTLEGEADWEFQRKSIASHIEGLLGVKRIINNITLKAGVVPNDLKQKISAAFQRSATVDAEKVNIEVSGSKVTLTGKVRSWAEKKDAESAVWASPGVNFVENDLKIGPEVLVY
ncbi:MAG: BON domain-containing protein [bacterium]|nr:BON domain-containing protein [bacterium]